MIAWKWLAVLSVCAGFTRAQAPSLPVEVTVQAEEVVEDLPVPKSAPSKVVAVTVFRGNALVTREVTIPDGNGLVEVVVTPLPAATIAGSLYGEGAVGLRVLSTRNRTRAVKDDARAEVRNLQEEIKALSREAEQSTRASQVHKQNLDFLAKLENFTSATMQSVTDKGKLDGEATIDLSKYVIESRTEVSAGQVELEQQLATTTEAINFAKRQLKEISAGSVRKEMDAVIVVDRVNIKAGTVKLNYVVGFASWDPSYRVRAGTAKEPMQLEYLASIEQNSGEPWTDVAITLSTAQPSLNATPPSLKPLVISAIGPAESNKPGGAGPAVEPSASDNRLQAQQYRGMAEQQTLVRNAKANGALLNEAAALDQANELLAKDDDKPAVPGDDEELVEGPSVTYHLKGVFSVPSRRDPQVIEVARVELAPEYYARAVPVLSPHVYRQAKLTNSSEFILLPGEASMYVGSDFVGRMNLPLVAIGEQFTVGLGVDPQLQIARRLVTKKRTMQGGNQVYDYEFRITIRSYKTTPVTMQVHDRLPKAEAESVAVSLTSSKPELSMEPGFVRTFKPDNLLRWDLEIPPNSTGEKSVTIVYQFKLEYAREMTLQYLSSGGLMEAPIGGMGGGMGGMGGGMR